jgi:PKD repeat protein
VNITIDALSSQPVQFIKNIGQSPDIIQYQAKTQDFSFDFTGTGIVILGIPEGDTGMNQSVITPLVVTLEGARDTAGIEPIDPLPGYANFLKGQNESAYQRYVPWYGAIRYPEILPGINLTYSGRNGILKREYLVRPGADPSSIRLKYEGAENITLTGEGSIVVRTPFGNLTEAAPFSYQESNGTRINVDSRYVLLDNGQVGFIMGEYNPDVPLVIDPYLEYSTYLGGSLEDFGMDIAMDTTGNAYVTGYTASCDFPVLNPINVTSPVIFNGSYCHNSIDVFVTKLTQPAGGNATIVFSTFIGGISADFGRGIAVDSLNDIYITGDTFSSDYPVMLPIQNGGRIHGLNDAFVTKIRSDGANFWYSSYLGGNFADQANDIALDSLKSAYITGSTVGNSQYKKTEENFPTTSGAYQEVPNTNAVMGDAFASKISPTGNSLDYSTYISGDNQDVGNGIAVDGQKMAYIIGTTSSSNLLPSGVSGYQKTLKGSQDAFLFKMNFAAGVPPQYATYLGGTTGYDYGEAVAVDTANCAYATGATASTDFPVTLYAKQKTKGWKYDYFEKDAYITKFSADGSNLEYSTYLGGSSNEWAYGIAVDTSHRAYVTGYTKSESFPKYDSIKSVTVSGDQDGFLTCVNADGSDWVYSTVFGGTRDEVSHGVAVSNDGNKTLLTGWTSSPSIMNLVSGDSCYNDCFPVIWWINQTTVSTDSILRSENSMESTYDGSRLIATNSVAENSVGAMYVGGNFSGGDVNTFDAFVMSFGRSSLLPSFSPNLTCGATPLTVAFTDTSGTSANIVQRIWNFGDGNVTSFGSAPQNVDHTYTSSGTYQVTLTVISYSGSAISDPVTINACKADISADYSMPGYNTSVSPVDVPWHTSITFIGSANFTPAMWDWSFDDSTANATGQIVTHQFSTQRIYNVTMTARGGCCGNYTVVKRVRSVAPPRAEFGNLTPRLYICPGDSVTFQDQSWVSSEYGPPTSWIWDFGDGSATGTTQNPSHVYSHAGTYKVSLTVSNSAGTSQPAVKQGYVIVVGEVDAGFDADVKTGLAPLQVNFTDKSTGYPMNWEWDFGDGSAHVYTQNATHTYTQIGRYYVNLSAWSRCGDFDAANLSEYITVNGNISPIILFRTTGSTFTSNKVNGTNPLTVYFSGNTTSGSLIDEFWWNFGDGTSTPHQFRNPSTWPADDNTWVNTSHQYTAVGDYTPVLNVINNTWAGTSTTGHQYDNYVGVYSPLIANFSVSQYTGVVGQQFQFTDLSLGSPSTWNYTFGDGNTSTEQNPTHAYAANGPYHVWLNVTNPYGAQNFSDVRTITINPSSTTGRVVFIPQDIPIVSGSGSARKIQLQLDRADYGLSSFTMKFDLDNTTSSNFYAVAERPWWIDSDKWAYNPQPVGRAQYMTLSGWNNTGGIPAGSVNVQLGNITLIGSSAGNNILRLNGTSIAQYGSSFMTLTHIPAGIHVYEIGALLGNPNPPGDLKPDGLHDGLLDDFDGNGVVNSNDVTTFFQAWSTGALSSVPVAPFDYNHNGSIDTDDIVKFFNEYTHW